MAAKTIYTEQSTSNGIGDLAYSWIKANEILVEAPFTVLIPWKELGSPLPGDLEITVPRKFISDGFSVPVFLRWRYASFRQGLKAAVLHDWLYDVLYEQECKAIGMKALTRQQADMALRYVMKCEGCKARVYNEFYLAVRLFAQANYR